MINLVFNLAPVAQARPRATRMGRGIRLYDPRPTAVFKKTLRAMASEQYEGKPLEGQLFVKIRVYRAVQKSISKKERELRLSHVHRPIVKSDVTNYAKSIEDALNGVLWVDDAMIVHEEIDKYYSENPRIEIEVNKIEEVHD